jgi:hypothetical protein
MVQVPTLLGIQKVEACAQCADNGVPVCAGGYSSGWNKCTVENNTCYYYTGYKQACH